MSAVPEKAAAAGSEATRCWTRRACEILRKLRAAEDIHKARHDLIDSLIWVALESLFPPGAGAMLQRSSPAVQHCQNRAAECERLAWPWSLKAGTTTCAWPGVGAGWPRTVNSSGEWNAFSGM